MSTIQVEADAVPAPVSLTAPPRRERWLDLLFVIGVALWQPIFTSTAIALGHMPSTAASSEYRLVFGLCEEAVGLAVLAYVLRKRHARIEALTRRPRAFDLPAGIAVYAVGALVAGFTYTAERGLWTAASGHAPAHADVGKMLGMQATWLWLLYQFVNPWFEEVIVRGFLMTEVAALAGMPAAVVASTLVQTSYHLYQGAPNAIIVGSMFLVFSLYYAQTRRLLPVIVAHTLQDVLALAFYIHRHH
jgi:membrane protease YdiL (CAAX protease family)